MSTKLTALDAAATIVDADILYAVTDIATVADSKRSTVATLFTGRTHIGKLELDQNSNAIVIDIIAPVNTTAAVIQCDDADALTTAGIFNFVSNAPDALSNRSLGTIHNDNTLAVLATCLTITQDADQRALFIDQNGNDNAIEISSIATTANVFQTVAASLTTGILFNATAGALTTGKIADLYSNSVKTETRTLVRIWSDDPQATGCTILELRQDANQRALFINSKSTTNSIVSISAAVLTTGDVLSCTDANLLTTGGLFDFVSNAPSTGTRTLGFIRNQHTSSVNATVLTLQQDAAERCLFIDQNGDAFALEIDSEILASDGIRMSLGVMTTGIALRITCPSSVITSGELLHTTHTASADGLANKTGQLNRLFCARTETRTTGTTVDNFDNLNIHRTAIVNGVGGTYTNAGSLLKLTSTATETAGTLTSDVIGIELATNVRSASDVYAIKITHDNSDATGKPGGIDFSTFSVDEPLLKFVNDAVTSAGTLTKQAAVDVGGTTYYINLYTTGT